MAETPDGEHRGVLANLGSKLIHALPPAFLGLALVNIVTLAAIVWLVQSNADYRNQLLTKIVESCLTNKGNR